ncbi:glycosyltransferase [Chamaesiphon sp. OTE_20_metabat_361]|uniref:glycosyltransferase n=1 Tax=Chamaesiphon sp. OTE_20_metabat_361 TaxID=2964689 RepID=UPI00286B4553|nr:glycosyltransferase [Chamaesiphon sp. OTE_20_metabat_361]
MRILAIALGSQGDVQPYVALGKGLQAAGHRVRVMTHINFERLVTYHSLEFYPVKGNVQEIVESPEMRALLEQGNFLAINKHTSKLARSVAIDWAQAGLEAARGMDLIVVGVGGLNIAVSLAEKLQIPLLPAFLFPFTPTRSFPGILFPQSLTKLGGTFNWLSHLLLRQIMWQGFRTADRLARAQVLNLPAASFWGPYKSPVMHRYPTLYGFSPSVIPKPADWRNTEIVGDWFLDTSGWTPPADLVEFLQNGASPVYIGFGSMGSRKPEETAELVLQAINRTGQRAILQAGWGGLSKADVPNNILMINSVPHSWLFPRMAAVVHHGGAGTTAAGLRAGVPSIVIPFFGDQPFWGQRIADLGVGTAPIPRQQLTVEKLAQAIDRAVTDPVMRQRAADLGAKIQAEDGVGRVVSIVREIEEKGL